MLPRSEGPWRNLLLRVRHISSLYILLLPTLLSMGIFVYFPKIDVVLMSFFRWRPPLVQEWTGFQNFINVFNDPLFWQSFELVGILLVANLAKMWPAIFAAIALHRLPKPRHRYIYQVLFVVPMVIPGLVWLLIWKSFYDPDFGILNRVLNGSGAMHLLQILDGTKASPGWMPQLAVIIQDLSGKSIDPLFGGAWGSLILAGMLLTLARMPVNRLQRLHVHLPVMGLGLLPMVGAWSGLAHNWLGFMVLAAVASVLLFHMAKQEGGGWLAWALWLLAGLAFLRDELWRIPALMAGAIVFTELVKTRFNRFLATDTIRFAGYLAISVGSAVILLGMIWTDPTGQFAEGTPAWLGSQDLVIPAVLFWGFPWVGTVGVLIYLSGLQQISTEVYEAARLDGVGPIGMLFRIELPLIMTQIRINLIFMTIGTLTAYEFFLILLGPNGGPGNKGMVPGLYMFKVAFEEGRFGYACALGLVMFVVILILTVIYNRYVKVEK